MSAIEYIYKGSIVDLRREPVTLPNGLTVTLEMVRHPGAAAVVAIDDADNVTLVRQYRYAAGGFIWEIPAGKLDAGEAPETCARRELREEAGLAAGELTRLGAIFTAPGFCDERIHLFLARHLTPATQQLEADEILSVERVPLREALAMIRSGVLQDAKSIAGLYHAAAVLGVI
ncbi:MAG TPA: NUDIX hydrolase [Candidatus Kryptonia bacterium]|nr:NUDIX hydrolase [Candidatus Kryptonia bacterium]